jgi:antitoxin (DNA-binding transcriptional repressor) of toxin-antitoxin stability system
MSTLIDIRELATRWEEALSLASAGREVVLTDGATPRARLVPCQFSGERIAGLHPGALESSPDFDAPLPDEFWNGQK